MKADAAYQELICLARERAKVLLSSCVALLAWDEETYMPGRRLPRTGRSSLPTSPAWNTTGRPTHESASV